RLSRGEAEVLALAKLSSPGGDEAASPVDDREQIDRNAGENQRAAESAKQEKAQRVGPEKRDPFDRQPAGQKDPGDREFVLQGGCGGCHAPGPFQSFAVPTFAAS